MLERHVPGGVYIINAEQSAVIPDSLECGPDDFGHIAPFLSPFVRPHPILVLEAIITIIDEFRAVGAGHIIMP